MYFMVKYHDPISIADVRTDIEIMLENTRPLDIHPTIYQGCVCSLIDYVFSQSIAMYFQCLTNTQYTCGDIVDGSVLERIVNKHCENIISIIHSNNIYIPYNTSISVLCTEIDVLISVMD